MNEHQDDVLERMRREAALDARLARLPGPGPVTKFPAAARPLVKVRAGYGRAVAYTPTHILHEWIDKGGDYHCRWDEKWQVHRVEPEDWKGHPLPS